MQVHSAITVAPGDGIGPEITQAVLAILKEAGARLSFETVELGEKAYLRGINSGIPPEAWASIRKTKVLLKGPITTPQGGGYKSVNVTLRKSLGLYANVRPCPTYSPFVKTRHPKMDVVIIRENEEDLYAGIEHRQTEQVMQCLKLITRPGCEKIVRYAFEYARQHGRKKVACFVKDNIMKLTDGLFHQVFKDIGKEYPDIAQSSQIIDIGAARLADTPEIFDVIVTGNLYGDIISDIAAQIAGSVGLAGSANIGDHGAMFEAIHGSAPDIAGRDIANPSGMLQAAIQMLIHIGQNEVAEKIQNAWLVTLEEGIHTADIYQSHAGATKVGTEGFAHAVMKRLGRKPTVIKAAHYPTQPKSPTKSTVSVPKKPVVKDLVGVDVFVNYIGSADELAQLMLPAQDDALKLTMITNRGVKVWPNGLPETFLTDHWRCRFQTASGTIQHTDIVNLYSRLLNQQIDVIKTENLCNFDGVAGFAAGQGQ